MVGVALLSLASHRASASEFGCTVLLCMTNPQGPKAVQECVDPIERLKKDLKKGKGFPACDESSGNALVRKSTTAYDRCPEGTTALATGEAALSYADAPRGGSTVGYVLPLGGIGDGSAYRVSDTGNREGTASLPAKICVGQKLGTVSYRYPQGSEPIDVTADVYDRVATIMPSAGQGEAWEIVINGEMYRRVELPRD